MLALVFAGAGERAERERQSVAWAVWHTASLNAFAYHKPSKMPSLDSLTGENRPPRAQTPEEMKAVFASMRTRANQ